MLKPHNPASRKGRTSVVRILAGLLLVPVCAGLPFVWFAALLGLSGDAPASAFVLMACGNVLLLCGLLLAVFRPGTHLLVLAAAICLPMVMFYAGYSIDKTFWAEHNEKLCKALRSNPNCVEDDLGFSCGKERDGMALNVPGTICLDKRLD